MAPPTSRKTAGLGRAIMNRKAKEARESGHGANHTTDGGTHQPSWMKLRSVTHEGDLEEFLNTAQMADTDFTAERRNVTVVSAPSSSQKRHNPYLLSGEEEAEVRRKQDQNRSRLRVPRRPKWSSSSTKEQLDRNEKDSFLDWRRSLAELQEGMGFVLTPFERNLEVWRQLWRVVERSDIVVQIVDARNPLQFRCEDLEQYVQEIEGDGDTAATGRKRNSLLLINKADLLDEGQRLAWAHYFDTRKIPFAFFSAANAAELQALEEEDEAAGAAQQIEGLKVADPVSESNSRILTVFELEALFEQNAPRRHLRASAESDSGNGALVVGLVGYPNVGKSSTINALIGAKKVSVSATPGKTKHFQTLHLSPTTILCDCPGLVFPQFATTSADLVVDGVLPIDQLREATAPAELVTRRIPKDILEATYGFKIQSESAVPNTCSGPELLVAYAVARGFARQGQGNPDESRAARYVLKDYVNAKLLYAQPPPGHRADEFNATSHQKLREQLRNRGRQQGQMESMEGADPQTLGSPSVNLRDTVVDEDFFGGAKSGPTVLGRRTQPMAVLKGSIGPDGRAIGSDSDSNTAMANGKKHFKSKRRRDKPDPNPYR